MVRRILLMLLLTVPGPGLSAGEAPATGGVLYIGDSHTYGKFGEKLHEELGRSTGLGVRSVSVCPATPGSWLKESWVSACGYMERRSRPGRPQPVKVSSGVRRRTPGLGRLLREERPSLVVIALGSNCGLRTPAEIRGNARLLLERVIASAEVRHVFWIGPPHYRGAGRIARVLEQVVGEFTEVEFIDGRSFNARRPLPARNPHFGPWKAARWAGWAHGRISTRMQQRRTRPPIRKRPRPGRRDLLPPPGFARALRS